MAFILGFTAVAGYQYVHAKTNTVIEQPQSKADQPMAETPQPTFALVPPSGAVSGTLTVTSGHILKYSRNDVEYKEASTGAQILIGESIATNENSTAVADVTGIVKASMGQVSELVFANLFPTNFVLQQKIGKIDYQVTKPISVRALNVLVTIPSGESVINIIDTDISITVKTGSVKFALVDTDNNTGVWNLKVGERANIDSAASQVYLVQAR
ncbi:MAG TPA: hypothetical protein ACFYEK_17285 [Candidatus Wunengus sp. YC60]|uniref:hypothetical protein n=1 Tax=Candidatus Wunengus sp. YC60 TaxID=3367697 RepID=UPI004027C6BA